MNDSHADYRFVGREAELHAFQEMLQNPYGEQRVMYIWGPGGIGKTWLAKEMLSLAQNHERGYFAPDLIDMYATGNQHVEGIIDAIMMRLKTVFSDDIFAAHDAARIELLIARQTVGYSAIGLEAKLEMAQRAFRADLSKIVANRPVVMAFDTFEHVHNNPVESWLLEDTGLQMPGLICIVSGRAPNPLNPEYPPLGGFTDDNAIMWYGKYTGMLLDEILPEEKSLVQILNQKAQRNPLLLQLALSWLDYAVISEDDLEQWTPTKFWQEIASWFHGGTGSLYPGAGKTGYSVGQTLILMSYLNRRFNRKFLYYLVNENFVVGDADAIWQELQHNLPDFFFVKERPGGEIQLHDILAEMLRLYVLQDAFGDLTGQRLRQFADRVVTWYDDLIEQTQSDSAKDIYRAEQIAYALRLDILNDLERNPEIRDTEEGWRLKRLLSPDFKQGKALLLGFQQERSDVLDRLIVHLLKPNIMGQFPPEEKYEFSSMLGNMARRINDLEQSREFWNVATAAAEELGDLERKIQAMIGLHNSTWQDDKDRSLEILREALKLCQPHNENLSADVLYETGFTYRKKELLDQAIKWYDKALKMARRHEAVAITPTILNDMGFALLLTGEYQRAKAMIQVAAQLRERNRDKLKKQVDFRQKQKEESFDPRTVERYFQLRERWREAVRYTGMSYNTLGQAYRFTGVMDRAIGYYGEALSVFHDKEIDDYYWQAQGLRDRGDAHRQLACNLFNQDRRESSLEYDKRAEEDIRNSLNLCEDYGLLGIIASVYRRLGRLFHDRYFRTDDPAKRAEFQDESHRYLQKGLEAIVTRSDIREELEIRAEITFWGDDVAKQYRTDKHGKPLSAAQGDEIEIQYVKPLQEALEKYKKNPSRPYHFDVFSELLDMERAAIIFETEAFNEALELYLKSYTGMARDPGFGAARCHRHFDHLLGNIRRLPDPNAGRIWCQRFMERWDTTWMLHGEPKTVAEAHPDLYEQLRLYADMVFAFEDLIETDEL